MLHFFIIWDLRVCGLGSDPLNLSELSMLQHAKRSVQELGCECLYPLIKDMLHLA